MIVSEAACSSEKIHFIFPAPRSKSKGRTFFLKTNLEHGQRPVKKAVPILLAKILLRKRLQ